MLELKERFRILLVDNDEAFLARAKDHVKNEKMVDLELVTAKTQQKAEDDIRKGFFHSAFVDVELTTGQTEGVDIIKNLSTWRPACERILITGELQGHWHDVFPVSAIIQDAYMKAGARSYVTGIESRYREWTKRRIAITVDHQLESSFFDKVTRHANEKRRHRIVATVDEFIYLLSQVFGPLDENPTQPSMFDQGDWPKASLADITTVHLEHMRPGKSGAIVLQAFPKTRSDRDGILSVIKIDTKARAYSEYCNFRRFVRFGRRRDRHVDLLGYAFGDTMGVLCYSFAGSIRTRKVKRLEELLAEDPQFALESLRRLFNPDDADFYSMSAGEGSLTAFFHQRFGSKRWNTYSTAINIAKLMEEQVKEFFQSEHSLGEQRVVTHFQETFVPPLDTFKDIIWEAALPGCVIHGDLHAGNVFPGVPDEADHTVNAQIVSKMAAESSNAGDQRRQLTTDAGSHGEVIMIDYYFTGPGPRSLDFAAMESSIRLATIRNTTTLPEVLARKEREAAIWEVVWGGTVAETELRGAEVMRQADYWEKMSMTVGMLARKNFENHDRQLEDKEYAATCLLWIMRLYTTKWLLSNERGMDRGALLAWCAQLCTVLRP